MRQSDPPVSYLVGTPKGKLTTLEAALIKREWKQARPSVRVKLLDEAGETYVLAEKDLQLLLDQMKLSLPEQPPPKITMPASP